MIPLVLSQGFTLEEELLLEELLLEELRLEELLLKEETKLLLDKDARLLFDEETKLLLTEAAKLLFDELFSDVGGGVLGLLLPPPPPQAVSNANILPNKTMCFNIIFPCLLKGCSWHPCRYFFDWIEKCLRKAATF
jgi:hypothetical protein